MTKFGAFLGSILAIDVNYEDRLTTDYENFQRSDDYNPEDHISGPVQKITDVDETSVRISCELNEICLEVEDEFLERNKIRNREKLHLGDDACTGTYALQPDDGSDGVWRWCTTRRELEKTRLEPDFNCGTKTEINSTHLVYKNSLTRNIEPGDVIMGSEALRTLSMPFGCAWPLNVFVSTSHESDFELHDTIIVESDVAGVGSYEAKMTLYQDETFEMKIQDMPVLDIRDNVFIGVELMNGDSGVNVIIERAWATPLPSPYSSPFQMPIVDGGCPSYETVEQLDVHLFANGESSLSTFSTSVFKFSEYDKAYLHAEVKVCFQDKNTCPDQAQICKNLGPRNSSSSDRFARSTAGEDRVVSIGPIYFDKNQGLMQQDIDEFVDEVSMLRNPTLINSGPRLGKTDILIASLLAVVVLLSMVVVTLYLRWRRASKKAASRKGSLNQVVTVTR